MPETTISLKSYVAEAAEEGCDHQTSIGDCRYRLLRDGHSIATSRDPFRTRLSTRDYRRLSRSAGFIIAEPSTGRPLVESFDCRLDLHSRWQVLREAA